jgi:hypothetical protein
LSRRRVLHGVCSIAAAEALTSFARASSPSVYGGSQATCLALAGDRYHNIDYIRTGLGKTLAKDLGISVDFTDELSLLSAKVLNGYRLLILFRDGMIWPNGYDSDDPPLHGRTLVSVPPLPHWRGDPVFWITPEQGAAVKNFVSQGGGVLFYHNTPFITPYNRDLRDVLGAVTEEHPPIRPFKVRIVNAGHPITRGLIDFVVTDEQHFVKYEKDPQHILLQSVNEDGLTWKNLGTSSPAGWAYDYGKGRVCYLAPGHLLTVLWNPEYEKIQRNAVKWLLKEI